MQTDHATAIKAAMRDTAIRNAASLVRKALDTVGAAPLDEAQRDVLASLSNAILPAGLTLAVVREGDPGDIIVPAWAWRAIETLRDACVTFAREAGPHMEAIDEAADAGEDVPSERFDQAVRNADRAIAAAHPTPASSKDNTEGAIYQCMAVVGDEHDDPNLWMDQTREDFDRLRVMEGVRSRIVFAHPQAAPKALEGELWLRPSDVTAIQAARNEGAEMVSILGRLQPHEGWPIRFAPGSVPDGWTLVPSRMILTPDALGMIETLCAGPDNEGIGGDGGEDRWLEGVLWVGETIGDHGEKFYGLNLTCADLPDEGSVPIALFDRKA